jgi:hypothetical protein
MSLPPMMSEADRKPKPPSRPWVAADQGDHDPVELARITKRNQLIVEIMEVNAKQRHLESLRIGLTLEIERPQVTQDAPIMKLTARLQDVDAQLRRLAAQRDFLETGLAEIDGHPMPPAGPPGRRS